jgi:arylsulfatase A-like enzyme
MISRTAPILVMLLAMLSASSCARERPRPIGLVIVTLDTTRADRLPAYGFQGVPMPALDRLVAEGVVFDEATSVAPLTLPAHCSLFTGLLPPAHGVRDNAGAPLDGRYPTLAETLRREGFQTAAFVGSVVLRADRGLARGFDVYQDGVSHDGQGSRGPQRPANQVVDEALAWLQRLGPSPFFLWVHLYDPHAPYEPPEPYRTIHGDDPYVGEIAFADEQIGRLVEVLDRRGLSARTVVVVAGDHGESLGDHGERGHGIFVYQSVMRVPLIVRAPGIAAGRVRSVTRLVDVLPTTLDLLGVAAPPTHGISLVPMMSGKDSTNDLEAYSESLYPERFGLSPLRALRDGRFKLIEAPRPELYDLQADPLEQRNIHAERPALVTVMARRLSALAGGQAPYRATAASPLSGPARERLAALGYVSGSRSAIGRAPLPDPKDHIDRFNILSRSFRFPCTGSSSCWPEQHARPR